MFGERGALKNGGGSAIQLRKRGVRGLHDDLVYADAGHESDAVGDACGHGEER
jgi:hypothetical protein